MMWFEVIFYDFLLFL